MYKVVFPRMQNYLHTFCWWNFLALVIEKLKQVHLNCNVAIVASYRDLPICGSLINYLRLKWWQIQANKI